MADVALFIGAEIILPLDILFDVPAQKTLAADNAAALNRETVLLNPTYVETVDGIAAT
jgi:hypothetical protein